MTDIAKCAQVDCPVKVWCYRYVAPVGERQGWIKPPVSDQCEWFIPLRRKANEYHSVTRLDL